MTPKQHDEYLRRIARDVRFLSYRASGPHPIPGRIFLLMLVPFLLIVVIGFVIEVGIQFHLIKPVPKRVQPTEEPWQLNKHFPKPQSANYR
jgi:hypothetical protein